MYRVLNNGQEGLFVEPQQGLHRDSSYHKEYPLCWVF